ncbi:MAG: choice-of-anchor L domain-containing protein, partial [Planctomycetaceae bacterium]|nr:choice-of-anchor L domain-containing protein [Planctomycetaceae bacterium]
MKIKHEVPTTIGLTDTTGRTLDGNADGQVGDVYNFWFQTGNTAFVDKNAVDPPQLQDGSLAHPFGSYARAIEFLPANTSIIRLVANGGTDGNVLTPSNANPYLFGKAANGTFLPDGEFLNVPKNVTVMIDAGAVLKFSGSMVNVGSYAQTEDLSGGALQVLGTPQLQVFFTSYKDDTLGGDVNLDSPIEAIPNRGDWGGIAFREDSDREDAGVFLSTVNHAQFTYGGGAVTLDSNTQAYTPIHLVEARPAVTNNVIKNNATAAISADPNSFLETLDRIGPEIHGNRVTDNSVNALLIRIETLAGNPIDTLDVSARFNETDITYLISENLLINGNPGSTDRQAGRLRIDPGAIVKSNGSRIETTVGASQFIAEGTAEHPIYFTSFRDDRVGSGGEFDVLDDGFTTGVKGEWGGLVFDAASSASIDHAIISFAGGTTAIEGGFDKFNTIEIHQATVRIANSTLENNASGDASGDRNGRGWNTDAVIFVRGAQPVIVNNIIRDNGTVSVQDGVTTFEDTKAISINPNSMVDNVMADPGRMTGQSDRFTQFDANFGPLIRMNKLANNGYDAMEVRGEEVLVGSVWDDTDITHYVNEEIKLTENFHTDGGLRLQSNPGESLVIKLRGTNAGFTVDGDPLEIDDRIGGSLHVLGRPGYPVVMTALTDDSVGAGFHPDGTPILDTTNDGAPAPDDGGGTDPDTSTGPIQLVKTSDNGNELRDTLLGSGITPIGNAIFTGAVATATTGSAGIFDNGTESIGIEAGIVLTTGDANFILGPNTVDSSTGIASGAGDAQLDTTFGVTTRDSTVLEFQFTSAGGDLFFNFVFASEEYNEFANSSFNDVFAFYIDGENIAFIPGTTTPISINTINGGDPLGTNPQNPQFYVNNDPSDNGTKLNLFGYDGFTTKFTAQKLGLSSGTHTIRMAISDVGDTALDTAVFIEAGSFSDTQEQLSGGEWRGINIDEYSNDRNVAIVNEQEKPLTGGVEQNGTPNTAQTLGLLAKNSNSGDDFLRLGYQVNGFISPDSPGDADVYSFQAEAGTEVWLDIDQSSSDIDLVLDLLKSDGVAFARSLESQGSQANPILATPNLNDLSTQNPSNGTADDKVFPLTKDPTEGGDYFGTNRRDPGMRVILPGPRGQVFTYFVRVRSQAGTTEKYLANHASVDLAKVNGGITSGYYELQIRLQQRDEVPGTTIQYADIRYATNGIQISGQPGHSPLFGEAGEVSRFDTAQQQFVEVQSNDTRATAIDVGNLLQSDRNTISIAGLLQKPLDAPNPLDPPILDVDFYQFVINYQQIQGIPGVNDEPKTWATVFDIDYADGLARPDTTISVFNSSGELIFIGRDSNIADDQSAGGNPLTDLRAGSNGQLDAYIGSTQLSEGTYYVAVSTSGMRPTSISTTFQGAANDSLARLEPISGVRRVVEDHIGFDGYHTGSNAVGYWNNPSSNGQILPISTVAQLQAEVQPLNLNDLVLYVGQANRLYSVNPGTGTTIRNLGAMGAAPVSVGDLVMRSDGTLFAYSGIAGDAANAGQVTTVDPTNGTLGTPINDSIIDATLTSDVVGAIALRRNGLQDYSPFYAVDNPPGGPNQNRSTLFIGSRTTGSAAPDPNDPEVGLKGTITGPGITGFTTGMAFVNGVLYGVSISGQLYTINQTTGAASLVSNLGVPFTGLTNGPQNAASGAYKDMLFATDSAGNLYALSTTGAFQPVFNGNTSVSTGLSGAVGLAFSPLDFNLWHPTMTRSSDAGHGINSAPDNSRNGNLDLSINGRTSNERSGGASFYFGLESWASNPVASYFTYGPNAQFGLTQQQHQDLSTNFAGTYNLPGGAKGALTTNSFSLANYSYGDKPTLYFNYFLETEDAAGALTSDTMRDSARVYVTTDNGVSWSLVATNNSSRSSNDGETELPFQDYDSSNATFRSNQGVQELFDNTGAWRQARIDLGDFAGNSNIRLRFEFSTSATLNGLSGDASGRFDDGALNN